MDLLRLGLERGKTAAEARDVIISLLEQHGQGGNCGLSREIYYNNSYVFYRHRHSKLSKILRFLIADRREAFILETYEKIWVWKRVKGIGVISNCYSIEDDWDEASPSLFPFAQAKGIKAQRFSFAKLFSDFTYTTFGSGKWTMNGSLQFVLILAQEKPESVRLLLC